MRLLFANFILSFFFLFCSCSSVFTARKVKEPMITAYLSGNMDEAQRIADDFSSSREGTGDELMWRLEEAKIKFDAGRFSEALKAFEKAEKLVNDFDERAKISARDAGAEAGAAVTNQNALPYRGFICDRILINAYKSMCYIALGDIAAGGVEIRRMHQKQKEALEYFEREIKRAEEEIKAKQQEMSPQAKSSSGDFDSIVSSNSDLKKSTEEVKKLSKKIYGDFINPFSLYLSAIVYLMNHNYNEANVDFRNLHMALPESELISRDFVSASKAIGSRVPDELKNIKLWDYPLDKNIVYLIYEEGIIAALREEKIQIILPPPIPTGYSGIAFPVLETFPYSGSQFEIIADGQKYVPAVISEMDSVFGSEFNVIFPYIITRLVISTIVKEAAAYAAQMAAKETGGDLAKWGTVVGTSIYKYMFNTADTRSWQTLPKRYRIIHFPKPKDGNLTISHGQNKTEIKLKETTNFAIIYVRSQSEHFCNINTFEF